MLITPPEHEQQCQFAVEVAFADGTTLAATCDAVMLE